MAFLKIKSARSSVERAHSHLRRFAKWPNSGTLIWGLLLFFLVVIVYVPAMSAGFIWDDDQLLTKNPLMPDPQGWWRIWLAPHTADYFPLTATTFWLEWRLWGLNPAGYHATNILLHGLATVLTWRVLHAVRVPGAWLAALLFGVHPVGVESVAWIAERKNTLAQVFFLLTLLIYFRFEKNGRRATFCLALACFALSLLAKTSVVMLPAVLWLCAWWQRGTVTREDVRRTIPFLCLALLLGLVTVYFQNVYAIGDEAIPIGGALSRLAHAGLAVWFYLAKILWPRPLAVVYATWKITTPAWFEFLPDVALLAVFATCWRWRAQAWTRAVLFGLGYFVITLLPVLGFLKMSYMRLTLVADHFQYLALIGPIALVVATGARWCPRLLKWLLASVIVLTCGVWTWSQSAIYKNEEALWRDTLRKNEATWQGHNHLGAVLYQSGAPAEAVPHFSRAVELKPDNPEVHNNLGLGYVFLGQQELALEQFTRAVQLRGAAEYRRHLAQALRTAGRDEEALRQYRAVVEAQPNDPMSYLDLGVALLQLRRTHAAIGNFQAALRLDPDLELARQYLAAAFTQLEQK